MYIFSIIPVSKSSLYFLCIYSFPVFSLYVYFLCIFSLSVFICMCIFSVSLIFSVISLYLCFLCICNLSVSIFLASYVWACPHPARHLNHNIHLFLFPLLSAPLPPPQGLCVVNMTGRRVGEEIQCQRACVGLMVHVQVTGKFSG